MSKQIELLLRDVHSRLLLKDPSIWGAAATATARERMGWLDLPERSRMHLPALDALSAWARSSGLDRVVLSGMGGSSLAPEVIAQAFSKELYLLDSTHPDDVHPILDADPKKSVFVISSKSGETIETLSHLKAIEKRLSDAGCDPRNHLVVISDPDSPLSTWAHDNHIRYFPGDPDVGGRFSALSTFGLVPSALLGIDCAMLLDDAAELRRELQINPQSAIALAREIVESAPFLHLPDEPLSGWIEQLIAESTGKDGKGIVPVISPEFSTNNSWGSLPLGKAFYLWECVTALVCAVLEVNPFDQPNVASAKLATSQMLNTRDPLDANESTAHDSHHATKAITDFFEKHHKVLGKGGYIALLGFAPKAAHQSLVQIQEALQRKFATRTTLGIGPRYLHSTGQLHKGGPDIGIFLLISVDATSDYAIPGAAYSFEKLLIAQAMGDYRSLVGINRPALHIQLSLKELEKFSRALHEAS